MKPQCETTADCLEQLARVMREFGFNTINEALKSDYVRYFDNRFDADFASFSVPEEWSFAIAKLEGKPVFLGSEVFYGKRGAVVCGLQRNIGGSRLLLELDTQEDREYAFLSDLSWTPPKQTVTLKVGDNEPVEIDKALAIRNHTGSAWVVVECETYEAAEQFRKAMKPLVKE